MTDQEIKNALTLSSIEKKADVFTVTFSCGDNNYSYDYGFNRAFIAGAFIGELQLIKEVFKDNKEDLRLKLSDFISTLSNKQLKDII